MSMWLVKRTVTVVFCFTRMSGPGYWPLKPYMTNVRPLIVRRTRLASRLKVSPSARVATLRGLASGNRAGSASAAGRYRLTVGAAP